MLSANAVAAVEDALLRGEWTQALNDSRSLLAARVVQLGQQAGAMTSEEERIFSVYLQTVFELDLNDEVETAVTITRAFAPLPSGVVIQWAKFLVAMNRHLMATQTLRELLESFAGGAIVSTEQYTEAAQVLSLQLLLPDEGVEAARSFVTGDTVLEDAVKLQLLRQIQAAQVITQEATKKAVNPVLTSSERLNSVAVGDSKVAEDFYSTTSSGRSGSRNSSAEQDQESSSYVMIGGTAIALAVAAAGALRYREKIEECVSDVLPAISKGLADAKYALFEA